MSPGEMFNMELFPKRTKIPVGGGYILFRGGCQGAHPVAVSVAESSYRKTVLCDPKHEKWTLWMDIKKVGAGEFTVKATQGDKSICIGIEVLKTAEFWSYFKLDRATEKTEPEKCFN